MSPSRLTLRGVALLVLAGALSALGGYGFDLAHGMPPSLDMGLTVFGLGSAIICVPMGLWFIAKARRLRLKESSGPVAERE